MRRLLLTAVLLAAAGAAFAAEEGLASWYGGKFQGRRTASGEVFDTRRFTAAHKSLPFGTLVLVTNLDNGRSITVRINDRGPFVVGRVIDLTLAAAAAIGLAGKGVAPVRLEVLPPGGRPGAGAAAAGELPASPGGEAPSAAGRLASYCLQLGAFRLQANAESFLARLAAAGFAGELESAEGGVTRVVIRGVSATELASLQERLAAAGWAEALVRAQQ